ncbi:VTT domain-containing protein [Candidatus Parcubacteria bacterium]|nr:VTT domain-containing protein [Candidatus Parcubacteria bacterium]
MFLESGIIFALPGDSLLFTAGLLASAANLNLLLLIPLIFLATFLGGVVGYHIGVYIESLHRYPILKRILKPEYIAEAHRFFEKHGKAAILMSRFVPLMRTFAPIAAGVARMPKGPFIRYSLVSSLLWSASITLAGYFLGQSFPAIKDSLSYFIVGIVVVSLLPAAVQWLRTRRRRSHTT